MTDNIKIYISLHPELFGILFLLIGIVIFISALLDANWLFGNVSSVTYSLKKIDGWVNMFGRKTARIVAGIGGIIACFSGIVWFVIYTFYME